MMYKAGNTLHRAWLLNFESLHSIFEKFKELLTISYHQSLSTLTTSSLTRM